MKTLIYGTDIQGVRELCSPHGFFELVDNDPELVIAHGGDGTLLKAEYIYPGIPKFLLKNSSHAHKAHKRSNDEVIKRVAARQFDIQEYMKLEARSNSTTLWAFNDIVVHNADPRHALRYTISLDDVRYPDEIIGDGVVVATPGFGASGYYRSITDSTFEVGIGLAFNNSHEQRDHVVLREDRVIQIVITRGPALCYADNQEVFITLKENERVSIQRSAHVARIVRAHM